MGEQLRHRPVAAWSRGGLCSPAGRRPHDGSLRAARRIHGGGSGPPCTAARRPRRAASRRHVRGRSARHRLSPADGRAAADHGVPERLSHRHPRGHGAADRVRPVPEAPDAAGAARGASCLHRNDRSFRPLVRRLAGDRVGRWAHARLRGGLRRPDRGARPGGAQAPGPAAGARAARHHGRSRGARRPLRRGAALLGGAAALGGRALSGGVRDAPGVRDPDLGAKDPPPGPCRADLSAGAGGRRALGRTATRPAVYGQTFALGSLRLTLHPAGHVLGSAQVRCEAQGLDLVYAGDIGGAGARASLTAETLEQLTCTTLAIRAVYGHPRYVFPPRALLLERLQDFVERALRDGKTPVIVGAALGEAQEVVRHLGGRRTLRLHPTAFRACEVYTAQGRDLKGFVRLDDEGDVVVVPPTVRLARLKLRAYRICVLSGRAVDGIAGADEALPLADHAGYDELLGYIRATGARRVLTIGGHAEDLAQAVRAPGIEALAIREQHQLALPGL